MSLPPKTPVFGLFDGADEVSSSSFGASLSQPIPVNTHQSMPTARNATSVVVNTLPGNVFGSTTSENVFSARSGAYPPTTTAITYSTHLNGNSMAAKTASVPLAQNLFTASPGPNADPFFDRLLPSVQTPTKFPDVNASVSSENGVKSAISTQAEARTPVRRPPTITSAVSTPNPVTPVASVPKVAHQRPPTANGSASTFPGASKAAVQPNPSAVKAPAKVGVTPVKSVIASAATPKVAAAPQKQVATAVANGVRKSNVVSTKIESDSEEEEEDEDEDDDDEESEEDDEESEEDESEEEDEDDDDEDEDDEESEEESDEELQVQSKSTVAKITPAVNKPVVAPVSTPKAPTSVPSNITPKVAVAPGTPKTSQVLSTKAITTPTRPPAPQTSGAVKFAVPTAPVRATPKISAPATPVVVSTAAPVANPRRASIDSLQNRPGAESSAQTTNSAQSVTSVAPAPVAPSVLPAEPRAQQKKIAAVTVAPYVPEIATVVPVIEMSSSTVPDRKTPPAIIPVSAAPTTPPTEAPAVVPAPSIVPLPSVGPAIDITASVSNAGAPAPNRRKPKQTAASIRSAVLPSVFIPSGSATSAPTPGVANLPANTLATQPVSVATVFSAARPRQSSGPGPLSLTDLQRPRALASFGFGGKLVVSFPRSRLLSGTAGSPSAGPVDIKSLHETLAMSDSDVSALRSFPGPLCHSASAPKKDEVLRAIDIRIAALPDSDLAGQSEKTLWSALSLLLKHGGSLSSELAEQELKQLLAPPSPLLDGAPIPESASMLPKQASAVVGTIQTLLVAGKRDDALAAALSNNLWAHALLISSLFGPAKYNETVAAFVNATLPEGSPMRMLFLLIAGRPQDAFGSGASTHGGLMEKKWRENLVMILANRSQGSSRGADSHILAALGDALRDHPQLTSAAHLCYLLASVDSNKPNLLGEIADPAARVVLLGVDHRNAQSPWMQSVPALQLSELYEYSKRSGSSSFLIPQLQIYKFIYAMRLAEVGLTAKAWKYIESIKESIKEQKGAYKYPRMFAHQFAEFASRLEQIITKTAPTKGKLEVASSKIFSVFGKALSKGLGAIIGDDGDEDDSKQPPSQTPHPAPSNVISPPAIPYVDPKTVSKAPELPLQTATPILSIAAAPVALQTTISSLPTADSLPTTPVAAADSFVVPPVSFNTPTLSSGSRKSGRTSKRGAAASIAPAISFTPTPPVPELAPTTPDPIAPVPISIPAVSAPPLEPSPQVLQPPPIPPASEKPSLDSEKFKVPKTKVDASKPLKKDTLAPKPQETIPTPVAVASKEDLPKPEVPFHPTQPENDDESFKTPAKPSKSTKAPEASPKQTPDVSTPSRLGFLNPKNWFSWSASKSKPSTPQSEKKPVEVKLGGKMNKYFNDELKMWVTPGQEEEARKLKASLTAAPPVSKKASANATPVQPAPSTPNSQPTDSQTGSDTPASSPSNLSMASSGRTSARTNRAAGGARGRKYVGQNNEIIETTKTPVPNSLPSGSSQPKPIPFPRMSADGSVPMSPLVSVCSSPLVPVPAGPGLMMPTPMSIDDFNAIAAQREAEASRAPEADPREDPAPSKQASKGKPKGQDDDDGYDIFNSKPKKKIVAVESPQPQGDQKKKQPASKSSQEPEPELAPLADDAIDDSDQIML